jgi:Flp pilus assembly protein TadD
VRAGLRYLQLGACIAFVISVAGCASHQQPRESNASGKPTKSKVAELNSTWAGQPYKALLAAYGQPSMIMEVPYAAQKTSVVIYNVIEKDNMKCSHAFTIVYGREPIVQNYFCQ